MHPRYETRLRGRALALRDLGRYAEAERDLREVIRISEKLHTTQHQSYADSIAELAVIYHDTGRFTEAEELYAEALAISEATSGTDSLSYVRQTNNLGYLYEDMGAYDRALGFYRTSLKVRKMVFSDNPASISSSQGNLARLLAKMGELSEAEQLLQQAIGTDNEYGRSNLYNRVTQLAIELGQASGRGSCNNTLAANQNIVTDLREQPEDSWRRMQAESWIGQLALRCGANTLAEELLSGALQKADLIYSAGSQGQRAMHEHIKPLLRNLSVTDDVE